jgi:hypothetical protein
MSRQRQLKSRTAPPAISQGRPGDVAVVPPSSDVGPSIMSLVDSRYGTLVFDGIDSFNEGTFFWHVSGVQSANKVS